MNPKQAQELLSDLFMLGDNSRRSPPKLSANSSYPHLSTEDKLKYLEGLVSSGADPTSVFTKSIYVGTYEEIEKLINLGADINVQGREHYPITRALSRNKKKIVKLLLEHNVDLNVTFNGLDPLLITINFDRPQLREILLNSSNINIKELFTIHNLLNSEKIYESFSHGTLIPLIKLLIDNGYDLHKKDNNGKNVFEYKNPLIFYYTRNMNHNKSFYDFFSNLGFNEDYILHDIAQYGYLIDNNEAITNLFNKKINEGYDLYKKDNNGKTFFDYTDILNSIISYSNKNLINYFFDNNLIDLDNNKQIIHEVCYKNSIFENLPKTIDSLYKICEAGYDLSKKDKHRNNIYDYIEKHNRYLKKIELYPTIEPLKIFNDKTQLSITLKQSLNQNKLKI